MDGRRRHGPSLTPKEPVSAIYHLDRTNTSRLTPSRCGSMKNSTAVLAVLFVSAWSAALAAQSEHAVPVLDPPPKILSLERPHDDWHVVTTIVLKIQPTTTPAVQRRFRWTDPQNGQLACGGTDTTKHQDDLPAGA